MNYQYGGKDVRLLQHLEERVRKNPASSFFAMLSYFYLDVDRVGEALSIAQRGVIAHPNYSTGHAVLAMAMMRAGLYMDARKELQKADQLHPGSRIIERLREDLDRQEQADSIGRKLAEQYRKNFPPGSDIMKTVEQTLKSGPQQPSKEDFLIPGLDAIVGDQMTPLQATLAGASFASERPREPADAADKEIPEGPGGISAARAIIDRVAREFGDEAPRSKTPARPAGSGSEITGLDMEALAKKLETAGPIKPAEDHTSSRDEDGGIDLTPEIVTETLALIFEQQGEIESAIEAYTILIEKKPEKEEIYRRKINELRSRTDDKPRDE